MYMNNQVDMIEGVERKINPNLCMKSQILGYGLCTSLRLPVGFREYELPYFPLSGPAHFGMNLIRGHVSSKPYQFLVTMVKQQSATTGRIEFSIPDGSSIGGNMIYTDQDNTKSLVLSTGKNGKKASVEFNYNTISHRAELKTKNNFLTKKDIITRLVYFNKTNLVSRQYGVLFSTEYDWYKFEHVTKYVRKSTGAMLHSSTLYYPKKSVTGVLEYNDKEQKLTARFNSNQLKQAVEFSGKWEKSGDQKGFTLMATHLTSGKFASFYGGYVNLENQKELITKATILDRTAENVLGYYNRDGIKSMENLISFEGKTAKFVAQLEDKDGLKTLKFTADIVGRKASTVFTIKNQNNEKSIKMNVLAAGKSAEAIIGYYKKDGLKSLKWNVDIMGRKGEMFASMHSAKGYRTTVGGIFGKYIGGFRGMYSNNHGHGKSMCSTVYYGTKLSEKEPLMACIKYHALGTSYIHNKLKFTWELKTMNQKGELAFDFQKHIGHTTLIAALSYNDQIYMTNTYAVKYKGMMNSELKMDIKVKSYKAGWKWYTKQIGNDADLGFKVHVMEKTMEILYQYKTVSVPHFKEKKLITTVFVNGDAMPVNTQFSYRYGTVMMNSELKMDIKVKSYKAGWKWYTKQIGSDADLGFKVHVMEKTMEILYQYKTVSLPRFKENKLITTVFVNGDAMPVNTQFSYRYGKGVIKPSFTLNVGKYGFVYTTKFTYGSNQYGWGDVFSIQKESVSIFKVFRATKLTLSNQIKQFTQKFGAVVPGRKYEYGWEAAYEKESTVSKTAHIVTFKLQYATKRKSSVTFTFANSDKLTKLLVGVEYIPTKFVRHSFTYDKIDRKFDISIEFLPTMFTTMTARLDKNDGYRFSTDLGVNWDGYKRKMRFVNTFKNNGKAVELSTTVGKDLLSLSAKYVKQSQGIKFSVSVLKHDFKFYGIYKARSVVVGLKYNERLLWRVAANYNKATRAITFMVSNDERTWFSISTDFKKASNLYTLSVAGKEEWMKITAQYIKQNKEVITTFSVMDKQWMKITAQYNKEDKEVITTFWAMEKQYFKIIGTKTNQDISIKFIAPQLKRHITFAAELNEQHKEVTLSVAYKGKKAGIIMRADWINYVAGVKGFYNQKTFGWEALIQNKAFTYRVLLTPTVSWQVVFEMKDDRILKMSVQHMTGENAITEASFHYKLSKNMCKFALKWNTKTIKKITDLITPVVKSVVVGGKMFTFKAWKISKDFVLESAEDMSKASLKFLNKIDKSFDDIDFIAARDKVGKVAIQSLRKISKLVRKSLLAIAKQLDAVKVNLPELIHKTKELMQKTKEWMQKTKEWMRKTKEYSAEAKEMLERNLKEFNTILLKVVTNLTESSRPIMNKAIALIKDFKIRGKSMNEIVIIAKEFGQKYVAIIKKEAKAKWVVIKIKGTELYNKGTELMNKGTELMNKGTEYILTVKIPYRTETVKDVIEIIKVKITELKKKISDVDVKKMLKEFQVTVMEYRVKGKQIKEHVVILKKNFKNLPKTTRDAILNLIRLVRVYAKKVDHAMKKVDHAMKKVNKAMKKVAEFGKPLITHLIFVGESVKKHFGPLYNKAFNKISNKFNEIELPSIRPYLREKWQIIEDFFLPLIQPIGPLYKNVKNQMRKIKVMGFSIGALSDLQMEMITESVEKYMKQSNKMMMEQMDKLKNYVEIISKMTPEEMVKKVFVTSSVMNGKVVDYMTKMYKKRQHILKDTIKEIKKLYNKLKQQYRRTMSYSVEGLMEKYIHIATAGIINTAEEISNLIKQTAALNFAGPTWRAWKKANLLGHLDNYGVNQKIMDFIRAAKDINLQQVLLDTIKAIKKYSADVYSQMYSQMFIKSAAVYNKLEKVTNYIRSIPKKEYDEWYAELKDFTLDNKDTVYKYMMAVYKMSRKRAEQMYNTIKKTSEVNYNTLVKKYAKPVNKWYAIVIEKSRLVYNDVKQPTIVVTKHYKTIISDFINERYEVVYEKAMKEYKKLYKQMEDKISEMRMQLEQKYEKFLNDYGDMTWEEIGNKAFSYSKKQTMMTKKMVLKGYKKLQKLIAELKVKAKDMYKKGMVEYKKYVKIMKTEIKPKVMKIYNKYKTMVTKEATKYMKKGKKLYADFKVKADKMYADVKVKTQKMYADVKVKTQNMYADVKVKTQKMYADVKDKAVTMYRNNKDKTLKAIYVEIKTIVVRQFNKQYQRAITLLKKQRAELKSLVLKYYKKADVLMRNVILPEMKKEAISIINQALRNTVIMANETTAAFYPHYVLTQDFVVRSTATLKKQAIVAFEKSKVSIKKNMDKMIKMLKELLEQLKNHKLYKKIITFYKKTINHKFVIKATLKIKELIKLTKEKIEELKSHPTTVEYKRKAEIKIAELKEQIAHYKSIVEEYYRHPKVLEAIQTLKQLQKSTLFTWNKIINKIVNPYYEYATVALDISRKILMVNMKEGAIFFRQQPEEALWLALGNMQKAGQDLYSALNKVKVTKDMIKEKTKMYLNMLKASSKELITEYTDEWTKEIVKQLYKDAIKMTKKVEMKVKALPGMVKKMMKKAYKTLDSQWKTLVSQWKICPCRAFVKNQIWKEIADEVINHELVGLARKIGRVSKVKLLKLKAMAIKEIKVQKKIFVKAMKELKSKVTDNYLDIKQKGNEKYKKLMKKYNEMIRKAERFVETTTIADIVEFMEGKYDDLIEKFNESKEKLMEMKTKYTAKLMKMKTKYTAKLMEMKTKYTAKLMKMKTKYTAKAKAVYAKYETKAKDMYKKMYAKGKELYMKMYVKGKEIYMKYKVKMMPYYKKYEAKVMKYYKKYQAKVIEMWNKYKPIAQEKYEKLYKQVEEKYRELETKTKEMYLKFKNEKFIPLTKMSIRETIEALKKLPKQIKSYVIVSYNKYKTIVVTAYENQYKRFEDQYNKVLNEMKIRKEKFMTMMKPYTIVTMKVVRWVENEVKQTAVFVYRYYHLADKYTLARSYVVNEYKRMLPLVIERVKRMLPLVKERVKRMLPLVKERVVQLYDQSRSLAKKYAFVAGHKTLRGIHSTMRYIDNMDVNVMKQRVRGYLSKIKRYITINVSNGLIEVVIHHWDITPSFSHHVRKIDRKTRRTIRSVNNQLQMLKIKVQKLKNQIQKKVMENAVQIKKKIMENAVQIQKKIMENAVQIQKKIMENVVEIRADIKQSFAINRKIVERLYSNGKIFARKSYRKAMVKYNDLKFKAKRFIKTAKELLRKYYGKGKVFAMETYSKSEAIFWDIYKAGPMGYRSKIRKYYGIAKRQCMKMYRKYKPIIEKNVKKQLEALKVQIKQRKKEVKPYYQTVKAAYQQWRAGVPLNRTFFPLYRQIIFAKKYYKSKIANKLSAMKFKLCKSDANLCNHARKAKEIHRMIWNKYTARFMESYTWGKAYAYKYIRKGAEVFKPKDMIKSPKYNSKSFSLFFYFLISK